MKELLVKPHCDLQINRLCRVEMISTPKRSVRAIAACKKLKLKFVGCRADRQLARKQMHGANPAVC